MIFEKNFRRSCDLVSTERLENALREARKVWENQPEADTFDTVRIISEVLSKRYINDVRAMNFRPMNHL
jgi:hypothetical protein